VLTPIDLGCARVWCTDRRGGVSKAPYDSLNLAVHVGDDPLAVRRNLVALAGACEGTPADPDAWVLVNHVHGTEVLRLDSPPAGRPDADGAATDVVGLPLVAIGADCAPIALANDTACAAVHSGWRGLGAGVVAEGVAAVRALGSGPVRALVGPCVSAAHYEFGTDDLGRLAAVVGPEVVGETGDGHPALDLRAGIHRALADCGVVEVLDDLRCTVADPTLFSFRRDGVTGRQGMVVMRIR
jgi:YfiH family protein